MFDPLAWCKTEEKEKLIVKRKVKKIQQWITKTYKKSGQFTKQRCVQLPIEYYLNLY